jgi:hypothetical protein
MQTAPGHATAYRRTFVQKPGRHDSAEPSPLTPAERIALTIALLNRGLDLMGGFARTSLTGCTRGVLRGRHNPEQERQSPRAT